MWNTIRRWFKDSETIFWARLQLVIGLVVGALTYVDPNLVAAVIPIEWVPIWMLASGLATEYLRRRRSDL